MIGRLHSRRFRHRLYWSAGGCRASGRRWSSRRSRSATPASRTRRRSSTSRRQVYREPARMNLTAADRRDLFADRVALPQDRRRAQAPGLRLGHARAGDEGRSDPQVVGHRQQQRGPVPGRRDRDLEHPLRVPERCRDRLSASSGARKSDWAGRRSRSSSSATPHGHPNDWLVASWVPKGIGGAQVRFAVRRAAAAEAGQARSLGEVAVRADRVPRPADPLVAAWGLRARSGSGASRRVREAARLQLELEPVVERARRAGAPQRDG